MLIRRYLLFNGYNRYVLDEYATARRAVLVRGFLDALTLGGPGGTPRPIEMHGHDPQRYVGDMLAWLHQAIPLEWENLQALLRMCDHSRNISKRACYKSLIFAWFFSNRRPDWSNHKQHHRRRLPTTASSSGANFDDGRGSNNFVFHHQLAQILPESYSRGTNSKHLH